MAYRINDKKCIACGACEPACPVSCISAKPNNKRLIDEDICINCGGCQDTCPVRCIFEVK
ncbi:MAG: 4Fe-4S ferredoxin [Spirochaetes bacterium GWD1_27_9]|nr:MAG: 4Fe-4S ferredoxin [Spirochaetes bacterium GWC1_27_15]OHD42799.1 MAG: 4Fe-4S ferredoxin [Spirochaetes bacterium GWD1_27_9]